MEMKVVHDIKDRAVCVYHDGGFVYRVLVDYWELERDKDYTVHDERGYHVIKFNSEVFPVVTKNPKYKWWTFWRSKYNYDVRADIKLD